jgi:hypothetical protein
MFVINKPSTIFSLDQFFVENSSLLGDSVKLSEDDSVKLSEGGSLKKFPRGVSGRVAIFGFKPARLKSLGSTLASGMIKNMSK